MTCCVDCFWYPLPRSVGCWHRHRPNRMYYLRVLAPEHAAPSRPETYKQAPNRSANTKLDVLQSNRLTFIYHYAGCSLFFDTWYSVLLMVRHEVQNSTKAPRGMWIISRKRNLLLTDNAIARSQTTLRVCLSKARSKHVTQTSEVSALESPWSQPCCSPFSHSRPGILHNVAN